MAACPNCGRRTMRTKDWVCQWCGYPLLYGNYKQIDKTFKELQEEGDESWKSVKSEPEPEVELEEKPEPEPKREPLWKMKKAPRPSYRPPPAPTPEPEPEPEGEIAVEPEAEYVADPEPAPAPPPAYRREPAAKDGGEPLPEIKSEPVIRLGPGPSVRPAAPVPALRPSVPPPAVPPPRPSPPQPMPPPAPMARPEPAPEPKPEPLVLPDLRSIAEGTELTVDQIDGMFRADSVGTSTALKDKMLTIKGVVNKVFIRDHLDIRYLIVTGTRRGVWSARCGFGKESVTQFSRLSEGQMITLRGKYDSYGKNIIFKDCTLLG